MSSISKLVSDSTKQIQEAARHAGEHATKTESPKTLVARAESKAHEAAARFADTNVAGRYARAAWGTAQDAGVRQKLEAAKPEMKESAHILEEDVHQVHTAAEIIHNGVELAECPLVAAPLIAGGIALTRKAVSEMKEHADVATHRPATRDFIETTKEAFAQRLGVI